MAPTRSWRTSPLPGPARSATGSRTSGRPVSPSRSSGRARPPSTAGAGTCARRRTGASWSCGARWPGRRGADGADVLAPPASLLERIGATGFAPLTHGGNSGAALLRASGRDGSAFVLKRVTAGADWLGRATGDDRRTAQLYDAGAFDRMPSAIVHGIVAVERAGDAAWVAMTDVQAQLLATDARLSRAQSRRILEIAAALHRGVPRPACRQVPPASATASASPQPPPRRPNGPTPTCCPSSSNTAGRPSRRWCHPTSATRCWRSRADPAPLADALLRAHGAPTLIHGDLRDDNFGFDGDRLVLIDWDLATAGTPTVEFAWYLAQDAWRIDATHDELEADHRAAHGGDLADAEVELGMLSGLVMYGWLHRPQRARPSRPDRDRLGPRRAGLVGAARAHGAGATRRSAAMNGQTT